MTISQMLGDLVKTGLSQQEIAELVGTSQPTINRALKGTGVRYDVGKNIERLHGERITVSQQAA